MFEALHRMAGTSRYDCKSPHIECRRKDCSCSAALAGLCCSPPSHRRRRPSKRFRRRQMSPRRRPTRRKRASGLASKVTEPGTGKTHPAKTDLVTVHYTGWTTDGKMFDSSVSRGKPATFPLDRVIAGWTEGVQLMVQGEKRRFWIPEALAYQGKRDPKGMLVFDVELISFSESPTQAPADVKAAPGDAKKTRERPGLQGASSQASADGIRGRARRSPCTTQAGRPTASCSTARSCAASRRRSRSTASFPAGPKACS